MSCNMKENKKISNFTFVSESLMSELDSIRCDNSYSVIYYFDGGCSGCIAGFLSWIKKWQLFDFNTNVLFITHSTETLKLEYYLDQRNIKLEDCNFLILDENCDLSKSNSYISNPTTIFVINRHNQVVFIGDPIKDEKSRKEFNQIVLR